MSDDICSPDLFINYFGVFSITFIPDVVRPIVIEKTPKLEYLFLKKNHFFNVFFFTIFTLYMVYFLRYWESLGSFGSNIYFCFLFQIPKKVLKFGFWKKINKIWLDLLDLVAFSWFVCICLSWLNLVDLVAFNWFGCFCFIWLLLV